MSWVPQLVPSWVLAVVSAAALTLLHYVSERIPSRKAPGHEEEVKVMATGSQRNSSSVVRNVLKSVFITLWGVGCGFVTSMAAPS